MVPSFLNSPVIESLFLSCFTTRTVKENIKLKCSPSTLNVFDLSLKIFKTPTPLHNFESPFISKRDLLTLLF